MAFTSESAFEQAVIDSLIKNGWKDGIIQYPTEKDLIKNWADIIFGNNTHINRLNDKPLTDGEMQQIMEQVAQKKTPLVLNGFINDKFVTIKRDNPDDTLHFGKEVALKIFDPLEIAAGQSIYQIVQQPKFKTKSPLLNQRRGDLMLLINGIPVIHIELKKSGIPISQAYNQIEKYSHEGVFRGIFSLIQVFVAMNPEDSVYFANPGEGGKFNPSYYFHWADYDNEPIKEWNQVVSRLLSIPMAHQLIGFYTVADHSDGVLKVMRSYQYLAASSISDKVKKIKWDEPGHQLGGYVWHTTGSGKTMTSFKSAQLIAASNDADKVVFLMDRIELGTQSLKEYQGFARDSESVQATENTAELIARLKSKNPQDTLIVTSIQKMSKIKSENDLNAHDMELMTSQRVVFIIDEAHRSTFGEMLTDIKENFPDAVFFGFTGTPIQEENQKKKNTTTTIFGDELHRYSIADGIRDGNVLGFDVYKILTFKDRDIRKAVALTKSLATTEQEALDDPKKAKIYNSYMNKQTFPMGGYYDQFGNYQNEIEDYLPKGQYKTPEHTNAIVDDIKENWLTFSHNNKFHAIFATSSIPEAINYYGLFKDKFPTLKVTCLFDSTIDNNDGAIEKEDALVKILEDYNKQYNRNYTIPKFQDFKKDVSMRLAHKGLYKFIASKPEEQLDLLIVVDQMLTGFDSKWVNTLYLDKVLEYANIIQAFSRTNRLFGPEKPFGIIRYYRKPHTMENLIEAAVKLYSGDKPLGLFVDKLEGNIKQLNLLFESIKDVFVYAGINNFEKLPKSSDDRNMFASLFNQFNEFLEAAQLQGFTWNKKDYEFKDSNTKKTHTIQVEIDKNTYYVLVQRYKELFSGGGGGGGGDDLYYDLNSHITEIDTGTIDNNYMNSKYTKYMKLLKQSGSTKKVIDDALEELHKTFAALSQEEQHYAGLFLHDIERGDIDPDPNKTIRDYITEYMANDKNDKIFVFADTFGLDEKLLREMLQEHLTDKNINEFGRLDKLKDSVDKKKAKAYFEATEGKKLNPPKVNMRIDRTLRDCIIDGIFLQNS